MFREVLLSSTKRLKELVMAQELTDFALIGALAVARWSRPRATADIDYAIALSPRSSLPSVAQSLGGSFREGALGDPLMGVVEYKEGASGIPVQLLLFPPGWAEVAFHRASKMEIDGVRIPIADWRALILLKLYAGSALDFEDAGLLIAQTKPKAKDIQYLTAKAARLRVSKRLDRVLGERLKTS